MLRKVFGMFSEYTVAFKTNQMFSVFELII